MLTHNNEHVHVRVVIDWCYTHVHVGDKVKEINYHFVTD